MSAHQTTVLLVYYECTCVDTSGVQMEQAAVSEMVAGKL